MSLYTLTVVLLLRIALTPTQTARANTKYALTAMGLLTEKCFERRPAVKGLILQGVSYLNRHKRALWLKNVHLKDKMSTLKKNLYLLKKDRKSQYKDIKKSHPGIQKAETETTDRKLRHRNQKRQRRQMSSNDYYEQPTKWQNHFQVPGDQNSALKQSDIYEDYDDFDDMYEFETSGRNQDGQEQVYTGGDAKLRTGDSKEYWYTDPRMEARQLNDKQDVTDEPMTTTWRPKTTRNPKPQKLQFQEQRLHRAVKNGLDNEVEMLCLEGVDPNAADVTYGSYTALHHAATTNNDSGVTLALIRCGADVHAQNQEGDTPLHLAIDTKRHWIATTLLLADADPGNHNLKGITPKYLAHNAMDKNLHFLISEKTLQWFKDLRRLNHMETWLQVSTEIPNLLAVIKLCTDGVSAHVRDLNHYHDSALHLIAFATSKQAELAMLLLRCGADVHSRNVDGDTPLHLTVSQGNYPATLALLLHKADPFIVNKAGQSAYELGLHSIDDRIKNLFDGSKLKWYLENMLPYP